MLGNAWRFINQGQTTLEVSMPPHVLASTFTSRTYDQRNNRLIQDLLGNFDLTSIDELGTIGAGCHRIPSGRLITGIARELDPDPIAYHVEIDQDEPSYTAHYKGIAFFNDAARTSVTKIAGFVKIVIKPGVADDQAKGIREQFSLDAQDEGTWVIIK